MKIKQSILISFGIALLLMTVGTAVAVEAPAEEWNKTFGDEYNDGAFSVQQTDDGGYIIAGYYAQDGTYYGIDAWLIKNYANGTEEWNMTFGGSLYDAANSVQQTSDGGYILAGVTRSFGAVETDAWLIKTYANGTEEWNRTFGGSLYDRAESVQQTSDGGYILAGYIGSDAWLIKTYANGTEEWNKTFDGGSYDAANSVQQTDDGGYIIAGYTDSINNDFWLIKTYANGTEEWNKKFDSGDDYAYSVQQTSDGGYIIAGTARVSTDDFWLIKTDENGTEEWNKKFDSGGDHAESVQQTSDGGYIIAGRTYSIANNDDVWLIKTYANGTEEWNKKFGGTDIDQAYSVQQTTDGGYIVAGRTAANGNDAWLIKVAGTSQGATTHYVGGDGYATIQEAVDAASDGDTILVHPGTYNENVVVDKSVNITSTDGAAATNVVAFSSADHAFNVTADYVIISGFNASGALDLNMSGIYLDNSSNTMLTNNIVEGNYIGILLEGICNNTMLTNNMAVENGGGIILFETDNCVLTDNTANDNFIGIELAVANNTILADNMVNYNEIGIGVAYSHNNRLIGNTAANSSDGIYILEGSSNNELTNNTLIDGIRGIVLEESHNNNVTDNTAESNDNGIYLDTSNHNNLTSNKVLDNVNFGINLWYSSNNIVMENKVLDNYPATGIHLSNSESNTLTGNNVSNNGLGIRLGNLCFNNIIYNNNFNNGINNVLDTGDNIWNSTEMLNYTYGGSGWSNYIGNYYSDYSGSDTNGDGIGDTSYIDNGDNYPLMSWPVELVDQLPIIDDPETAIGELQDSIINELELDPGISDSLILRLDAVVKQLEKGDEDKAIKKLEDFINYVNRLPTRKLDLDSANFLIDEAENIIKLIENSEG